MPRQVGSADLNLWRSAYVVTQRYHGNNWNSSLFHSNIESQAYHGSLMCATARGRQDGAKCPGERHD
jgi:hypothetical protein